MAAIDVPTAHGLLGSSAPPRNPDTALAIDDDVEQVQPRQHPRRCGAHHAVRREDREQDPVRRARAEVHRAARADRDRARDHLCAANLGVREGEHEVRARDAPCKVDRAHQRHLAGDVRPAGDPARERRVLGRRQLCGEVVQPGARAAYKVSGGGMGADAGLAYGMDEASSAMEAATVMTKSDGMSQPNTMPTWPPARACHS